MNNIKKYIIWFIIWVSLVWSVSYANTNWSIGALFNAADSFISPTWNKFSIKKVKTTTLDLWNNWEVSTDSTWLKFTNTVTSKTIKFWSDASISADEYKYN